MRENNYYSIKSTIELKFNNPQTRDVSYNSFFPEFNKFQAKRKRSKLSMEKKNNNYLVFHLESTDITAFRASINEIISSVRIFENTLKIFNNSS
ncbi:MAG: KEOPS complex subunit Pcc1 [Promethearchaeota archaeon]